MDISRGILLLHDMILVIIVLSIRSVGCRVMLRLVDG